MPQGIAQRPTVEPSELDKAYAAAYIDGEGCITLAYSQSRAKSRSAYVPTVLVSSVGLAPLEFLRDRWGGSIRLNHRRERKRKDLLVNERPVYTWGLASRMAETMLRDIRPYLLLKGAQADLVFEYYRFVGLGWRVAKKGGPGYLPITPLEAERRDGIYAEIHRLNRRGRIEEAS